MANWAGLVEATGSWMLYQVSLVFASYEEIVTSLIFVTQADKQKAVIQRLLLQWFSQLNLLVKDLAHVQWGLSKHKPGTLKGTVEERWRRVQSISY